MTVLILSLLIAVAVITDSYSHKIPNMLTGPGLLAGLILSVAAPIGSIGLLNSVLGILLGFLILLPGYALGKMGAGDVKLMAMAGAFLGPYSIIDAGVITLIAGGVLACLWVLTQKMVQSGESEPLLEPFGGDKSKTHNTDTLNANTHNTDSSSTSSPIWKQRFPYALAIAIGCGTVIFTQFTLFAD